MDGKPGRITALIDAWGAAPENSARTVLVTIFGDTLMPVSREIWLAQLFQLTEVLGFSERLVRTSVFRLAADGWLHNERVGRQSRYTLTDVACKETSDAGRRIYHDVHADWSGPWSVAFLDAPSVSEEDRERLDQRLRWHGFMSIAPGVLAAPTISPSRCRELCEQHAAKSWVPTSTLSFDDLNAMVSKGFFDAALALDEIGNTYAGLVDLYGDLAGQTMSIDGPQAFALRTMLVHDLRRIRLRSVDLPTDLLPGDWPGAEASRLATRLYHELSIEAAPWLSDVLDVNYPKRLLDRLDTAPDQ